MRFLSFYVILYKESIYLEHKFTCQTHVLYRVFGTTCPLSITMIKVVDDYSCDQFQYVHLSSETYKTGLRNANYLAKSSV